MIDLVWIILAVGALLLYLSRSRREWTIGLALACASLIVGLYLVEGVLEVLAVSPHHRAAWWQGVSFDPRSKARVVDDLRRLGRDAQPNVIPSGLVDLNGLAAGDGRIFPLAGISGTEVVFCNDAGPWVTFTADEYGFRNPARVHRPGEVDLVLLGDSFIEGQCVNSGQDVAGWLRQRGYRAVSLGMSGNGPLIELAALTEYATHLRPLVVVWTIYQGNDADDLARERTSEILMRYLEQDFSQGLIRRQGEIDEILRRYVEARRGPPSRPERARPGDGEDRAGRFLHLRELERRLVEGFGRFRPRSMKPFDPLMARVLDEARRRVEGWGGRLVLLYLPERRERPGRGAARRQTLRLVEQLGIPLIDVSETLASHPDPESLYPLRLRFSAHFDGDGYRLVADALAARLPAARGGPSP